MKPRDMSCETVIDSNGKAVHVPVSQNIIRFIPCEVREKEMRNFEKEFKAFFSNKEIDIESIKFYYLFQPFYIKEKFVFFCKTEFSSSSQAVKIANEIDKHPDVLKSKEKTEFLQSIIPFEDNGKTRWYFLNANYILFERNYYDCKRIKAVTRFNIPYVTFYKEILNSLLNEDEQQKKVSSNYIAIKNGLNINKPDEILQAAFVNQNENIMESPLYSDVNLIVKNYMDKHFKNRDAESNIATNCLISITGRKNHTFEVYEKVKNIIVKNFKNSYGIQYSKNKITAVLNGDKKLKVCIYIASTEEPYRFIIGGNTIIGLENLREYLLHNNLFDKTKWFEEKVEPNIR